MASLEARVAQMESMIQDRGEEVEEQEEAEETEDRDHGSGDLTLEPRFMGSDGKATHDPRECLQVCYPTQTPTSNVSLYPTNKMPKNRLIGFYS